MTVTKLWDHQIVNGYIVTVFSGLLTNEGEGQKGRLPKICHTYPKMMKLGTVIPKEDLKSI